MPCPNIAIDRKRHNVVATATTTPPHNCIKITFRMKRIEHWKWKKNERERKKNNTTIKKSIIHIEREAQSKKVSMFWFFFNNIIDIRTKIMVVAICHNCRIHIRTLSGRMDGKCCTWIVIILYIAEINLLIRKWWQFIGYASNWLESISFSIWFNDLQSLSETSYTTHCRWSACSCDSFAVKRFYWVI